MTTERAASKVQASDNAAVPSGAGAASVHTHTLNNCYIDVSLSDRARRIEHRALTTRSRTPAAGNWLTLVQPAEERLKLILGHEVRDGGVYSRGFGLPRVTLACRNWGLVEDQVEKAGRLGACQEPFQLGDDRVGLTTDAFGRYHKLAARFDHA
jgi:hypothetical protein